MRVLKFGGTSVASAERLRRVARVVFESHKNDQVVVVVSAMAGVTDMLVAAYDQAVEVKRSWQQTLQSLSERHLTCMQELGLGQGDGEVETALRKRLFELSQTLEQISAAGVGSSELRDRVVATGERLTAPLAALALRRLGHDAISIDAGELIVTDSTFGEGEVDFVATGKKTRARFVSVPPEQIVVVTGFVAADTQGRTTTLGRGGSDYSASVLGASLPADVVEIWTDVNGVMSASPQHVPTAITVPELSYEEASQLARFGAKVLHHKTMQPLQDKSIPILVCNTHDPFGPSTRISPSEAKGTVRGKVATAQDGWTLFVIAYEQRDADDVLHSRVSNVRGQTQVDTLDLERSAIYKGAAFLARTAQSARMLKALNEEFASRGQNQPEVRIRFRDAVCVIAVAGDGLAAQPTAADELAKDLNKGQVPVLGFVDTGSDAVLAIITQRGHVRRAVWVAHQTLVNDQFETNLGGAAVVPALVAVGSS